MTLFSRNSTSNDLNKCQSMNTFLANYFLKQLQTLEQ